jgi:hypothetical protein
MGRGNSICASKKLAFLVSIELAGLNAVLNRTHSRQFLLYTFVYYEIDKDIIEKIEVFLYCINSMEGKHYNTNISAITTQAMLNVETFCN